MATYQLSQQQLDQFNNDGYLLLRSSEHKLVDPAKLQEWATEVQEWPQEKGKWMPYEEVTSTGEKQIMRTEKFVDYHDNFKELLCGPRLRSILAQISGDVCDMDLSTG